MNFESEVIELKSVSDTPTITLSKGDDVTRTPHNIPSSKSSVNFGGGLELLMNGKRKSDGSKANTKDIGLEDLDDLENQLNSLTDDIDNEQTKSKSGLFNKALHGGIKLRFDDDANKSSADKTNDSGAAAGMSFSPSASTPVREDSSVGKATASSSKEHNENKTWDGFKKFNDIPVNPDQEMSEDPKLSKEDLLREKFKALRKLEDLERKGVKLSKRYTMESDLAEMQGEYEMIIDEKERSNSCKFQGRMLMAAVTGIEFLNNRFDPFDIKLDGWSEQINENVDDYDEIFAELHEKYKSKAKMAPELKLLFQLGGSAIMVHMTNTMFKSSMPGMDDIMRQNPELMQQFTQAAVNSMGDTNPGFGGFMNNVMGNQGGGGGGDNRPMPPMPPPSMQQSAPPAPMRTQTARSQRAQTAPHRPDINEARGRQRDGISIEEQFGSIGSSQPERSTSESRPEMKGPSNISDLLSGLKTKNINMSEAPHKKEKSTISIQELKEISNAKAPARSKRRPRSEKNTVSLEL
jgi:hypothetical protein